MSTQPKKRRGIHSAEDVKARCEVIGNCWHWTGSTTKGGYPTIQKDGGVLLTVRWLFEFVKGRKIKAGHVIRMRCGDVACVSPHCWQEISRGALVREQWSNGRRIGETVRQRVREQSIKTGWAKLNAEKAQEIREKSANGVIYRDIAQEYGVSSAAIGRIVRGESWPELNRGASVFNFRPAA